MAIDASIYSNAQTPDVNMPSPLDAAESAMRLSTLGMQRAQMARQIQQQGDIRQALAQNTDQNTGQLDQAGFLSTLGKKNPMAAMQMKGQLDEQNKNAAQTQVAQMQATHQIASAAQPKIQYMMNEVPPEQRPKVWPQVRQELLGTGVPENFLPAANQWSDSSGKALLYYANNLKEGLENQMIASNVGKAPAERQALLYGPRSANAELTGQYDKQVDAIRKSQDAMNQMIDNYNNPSPQGYASLKLNAFRIKFPNAPDVNSLDELSKAQGATDQMKAWVNQHASGMDQATMDNLMRDAVSTYRSKVDTLRGVQKRIQARQAQQGVNDPTLTYEPAIEKTYSDAVNLQNKIGPYVPPSQRGGFVGGINNIASKIMGIGGGQSAQAATPAIKHGTVEDGYVYMGGDPGNQSSWKRVK